MGTKLHPSVEKYDCSNVRISKFVFWNKYQTKYEFLPSSND